MAEALRMSLVGGLEHGLPLDPELIGEGEVNSRRGHEAEGGVVTALPSQQYQCSKERIQVQAWPRRSKRSG